MRQYSDHSDTRPSVATPGRSGPLLSLLFLLITAVTALIVADLWNGVDVVLETRQCLTGEGAEVVLGTLRHFVHHLCHWIF